MKAYPPLAPGHGEKESSKDFVIKKVADDNNDDNVMITVDISDDNA